MGRARDELAQGSAPAEITPVDGTVGERIPEGCCRLCWNEHFVRREGVWMLEHRGGPLSRCTHHCHDNGTLLPSTS